MSSVFDWPGKSDKEGNERPAVLHMLDVATCAELLIEGHTAFAGLSNAQCQALVILVGLHDIGKISESFRALVRNNERGNPLHWQLSHFLLCGVLDEILCELGGDYSVREELYAAVAGHHGQPPSPAGGNRREKSIRKRAIGRAERDARNWVTELLNLFPGASLEGISVEDARGLSWVLSGITVAADWVGSNTQWFPIEQGPRDFGKALIESKSRARKAVVDAGLEHPRLARLDNLAPYGLTELRPMQEAAMEIKLDAGPQLIVIEDSTGTGKTEAALILAHRMIENRKARGIFFALPTMATSNAMFERMTGIASQMYERPPSVVLAHSKAKLSAAMRDVTGAERDETPEATGTDWLTDGRRRTLLATVGVGTVDQALLGVLPTRFSTLRLFGLADKLLIVDEAHGYDPYMQRELETLLTMHARLGGSAILMTASLPLKMRQAYVSAFQRGLGRLETSFEDRGYPGMHLVSSNILSVSVRSAPASSRRIEVNRISSQTDAIDLLVAAKAAGAACVWIRNAVDDAIDAALELRKHGIEAYLLHARFALIDRLKHENKVMNNFGKKRKSGKGKILIATQVVEASLDLDFDVMVSDLAPIGSLVQRAGRLWRHIDERPESDRPVPGPCLHVVSPDPNVVNHEKWLHDVLDRGAWVYRLDDQWRTAKVLFDTGKISAPDGLRTLMEAVHGDTAPILPEELMEAESVAVGEAMAQTGLARGNLVEVEDGYLNGTKGAVGNDAEFPTRIGIPQVTIVLAQLAENRIVPWASEVDSSTAWFFSEVTASRDKFANLLPDQDAPELECVKINWPKWRKETCRLCVVGISGQVGHGLCYDVKLGLRMKSPS